MALLALLSVFFVSAPAQQVEQVSAPRMATFEVRTARLRRFLGGRALDLSRGSAGPASAARALEAARQQQQVLLVQPRTTNLTAAWTPVGPAQVLSASYGDMTGRVTAIVIDPADATGNTVYVGSTGGGVWKSTNAAGPAGSVQFVPLTDTLSVFNLGAGASTSASLSIGALAMNAQGVLLAGTGDPNDATDSYYGAGVLRSVDGGLTWTLATGSRDGVAGNHSFFGLSFAALAFSSVNPSLVVAAVSTAAEGQAVNAPDATYGLPGLYLSADGGVTWQLATIVDGTQTVQAPGIHAAGPVPAATAVVWNPVRQRFLAAVRYHGYYESADGATWTRLAHQPGTALSVSACPANPASTACPIFRGALAVQPGSGDTFALTVNANNDDQGLYQDVCAANGSACTSASYLFGKALNAAPLEAGSGSKQITQADYDLALAAVPNGSDTLLYVGTVDLYRCSLSAGCVLRNTTNAQNGCANPAGVAPAQHALVALAGKGPLVYTGNDGGLYRSADGVDERQAACSADDAAHFDNLNGGLGSLAEVVSFAEDPAQAGVLLAGLGGLGSAGTGGNGQPWTQLATGEGGTVAIDPGAPGNWYLSLGAGVQLGYCGKGAACTPGEFASSVGPAQTANDPSLVHAPWLLDPQAPASVVVGTCRAWRGPAASGAAWTAANALSAPFGAPAAAGCSASAPVVRSLAAGGPAANGKAPQSSGSAVLYAGLAGAFVNGSGLGGHLFRTSTADGATSSTAWRDAALGRVTNAPLDSFQFNPGSFDVSAVAVDAHDTTGNTVYATVMGFAGNGTNAPHVYGSTDGGTHWLNLSANLPNAPANSVVVDPNDANTVYVALDTGVYVTTQVTSCASTNCWSLLGTALPNAPVIQLAAAAGLPTNDGRLGLLRAATYGRGIWSIPLLNAVATAAPAMSISPPQATFGPAAVGSAGGSVTFTVTNTGNAALYVTSVSTSTDFPESNQCVSQPVAPGATCSVTVTFLPTATGARSGLLTVYGNVSGGQATAVLNGTGTSSAEVVLTPNALVFAATTVGASSAVENVTISNTGGTATSISVPQVTGDFSIRANTCGTSLAAQTGCTVSIVFTPGAAGARSGTLSVSEGQTTEVATLSGRGSAPATDALSPAALAFAAQQVGTASTAQTVTLTNAGDAPLTLVSAQITAGDFAVANSCGSSLAGHASCAFSVTYVPKAVGAQSGVLTVADAFRTQTVPLTGTGLAPAGVSLLPAGGLVFGGTGVGLTTAAQMVTLTNNGGVPLLTTEVRVSGDFTIVAGMGSCGATGFSLDPGAACSFAIAFSPTAAGARTGTLTVADNGKGSPQSLALNGTGVDFALTADGPAVLTVRSGQTASYLLLLSSLSSLNGPVTVTCSGIPADAACAVSPAQPSLGGSQVLTVTLATGLARLETRPLGGNQLPEVLAGVTGLGLLLVPRGRMRRYGRGILLMLLVGVPGGLTGCSAPRTIPGVPGPGLQNATPAGSYGVVVTGSAAGLVRAVNLTLVVQ